MQQSFTTAQVAGMAGVHRDTLLRWLRERSVPEPRRDRHGWRVFTAREAAAIADFAKGGEIDAEAAGAAAPPRGDEAALARLAAVEWDFASARTGYLTHNLHPYPAKFIPQIPNALIWLGHDPEPFKKSEIGSHRKYSAKGRDRAVPETFRKEFESIFQWLRGRLRDGRRKNAVPSERIIRLEKPQYLRMRTAERGAVAD